MIQITDSAAERIRHLEKHEPDGKNLLRVRVARGGCSGLSYKMEFDSKPGEKDKVFEHNGIRFVVDSTSYLYLLGMSLDFDGGLNGRGFVFSNPNASKTCGCGSSFAV